MWALGLRLYVHPQFELGLYTKYLIVAAPIRVRARAKVYKYYIQQLESL